MAMTPEEARAALWRRQRLNRKANNQRLARRLRPTPDAARITRANWNPIELMLADWGKTEPEDYDSDKLANAAGEQR